MPSTSVWEELVVGGKLQWRLYRKHHVLLVKYDPGFGYTWSVSNAKDQVAGGQRRSSSQAKHDAVQWVRFNFPETDV